MKTKTYVITGATSGIGKALVEVLSKENIVFAGYRSEQKAQQQALIYFSEKENAIISLIYCSEQENAIRLPLQEALLFYNIVSKFSVYSFAVGPSALPVGAAEHICKAFSSFCAAWLLPICLKSIAAAFRMLEGLAYSPRPASIKAGAEP